MTIRTQNRKFQHGLFLAFTLAAVCVSRATIPEPDAVIYGHLFHRFDQPLIPTQSGEISVIAQVNGTTLVTTVLAPGTNTFLLRIPMDDGLEPRQANTGKATDRVHFIIRNNLTLAQFECVQSRSHSWTLPADRAPVVAMNLSVEGNVAGIAFDSNSDGIPDYWTNHLRLNITSPRSGQRCSNSVFTVTGSANGSEALTGVWYQLNGAGWVPASTSNGYSNWTANVTLTSGTNLIKAYTMDTTGNCSLTNKTSFVYVAPNPFIPLKGIYNGLFHETNGVSHETSGFFTFSLTEKGLFTGDFLIGGGSYRLTGKFDAQGHAQVQLPRKGKTSLTVSLALDLTPGGTDQVNGSVTEGSWTAALLGDHAVFNARTNPAPQAGNYTMIVAGASDSATSPAGDSIGIVNVSRTGLVSLSGTLADGKAISQKVSLSKNGYWPLYVPLYSGKGSLLSWIVFSNQTTSSFTGNLSWIKTAAAGGKYYPGGFSNDLPVIGSQYQAPTGTPVLDLSNSVVVLSAGNLSAPLTNSVTLSPGNLLMINPPSANNLHLTFSLSDGRLTGSFLNPQTGLVTPIKAVVLQQQNTAQGFFLGTNQSGRVLLKPEE